jgi:ABC-type microcin C transport system duplicated ATPase subunit YejF
MCFLLVWRGSESLALVAAAGSRTSLVARAVLTLCSASGVMVYTLQTTTPRALDSVSFPTKV